MIAPVFPEGQGEQGRWNRRLLLVCAGENNVYSFHMKIVIMGAGTLGVQIARELVAEKRDVVIIERNPDISKAVANELDCLVCEEDGENIEALDQAGLSDADWFIALSGSDETNIVACGLVAESFSKPKTIARVRSNYFSSFHGARRRLLGVDHILNPESETSEAVARILFRGMSPDTIDVKEAGIQLRKITASEDPRLPGTSLQELRAAIGQEFMVPAVLRDGGIIIPSGDFVLGKDDGVYLLGEPRHLDFLFGRPNHDSLKIKYLVIFGANALTRRVLKELGVPGPEILSLSDRMKRDRKAHSALSLLGNPVIKVIDESREQAKIISTEFPDVEVVRSNFSDELLIQEEGIDKADILLSLTNSQSDNIVLSLVAKSSGTRRTLAVVHNDLYMRLEGSIDVDAIVNQKSVVAGAILDIIRKAHIRRLYSFHNGDFELVEITITEEFRRKDATIIDLGLPRGILVAFVIHEGKTIIPTGSTEIHKGDQIGIVLPKEQMNRLESLYGA